MAVEIEKPVQVKEKVSQTWRKPYGVDAEKQGVTPEIR